MTDAHASDLSATDHRSVSLRRLSVILSCCALFLSLLAVALVFLRDPLGSGVNAYDFTTPEAALASHLRMESHPDIRAEIELAQLRHGKTAEEKRRTIKVHKESSHGGKKLLFVSFEENGISTYDIEAFEKDADTGWWFPAHFSTYDIDDSSLEAAVKEWQAKSGSIEPESD